MKKILIFIICLATVSDMVAQTIYKAYTFQTKEYKDGRWGNWSESSKCNIIVSLNDKEIIFLANNTPLVFTIIEQPPPETDNDGDIWVSYYCMDPNGDVCKIQQVILYSRNRSLQMYVKYTDMMFVYNIHPI